MPAHAAAASGAGTIERFDLVEHELDRLAVLMLRRESQPDFGGGRSDPRYFGGQAAERAVEPDGVDAQLELGAPALQSRGDDVGREPRAGERVRSGIEIGRAHV